MSTSFNLSNTKNIAIDKIDLARDMTFTTANWVHPVGSNFSQGAFWDEFLNKHTVKDYQHAIELLIDIARCHFSPKPENWPGVQVTVSWTAGVQVPVAEHDGAAAVAAGSVASKRFTLEKGKTSITNFVRGRGSLWSYTNACLATAGLFRELFHSDDEGRAACNQIPGNSAGYTQFCGLLNGWTQADQTAAENAFEAFITQNGLKEREEKIKNAVKAAAAKTITNRTAGIIPPAMGMRNILRIITGVDAVNADNPVK